MTRRYARLEAAVLNCLRTAAGGIVSNAELIEAVYPDPDGEPDSADGNVKKAIFHLRKRGFPIRSAWGRGYFFEAQPLTTATHSGMSRESVTLRERLSVE